MFIRPAIILVCFICCLPCQASIVERSKTLMEVLGKAKEKQSAEELEKEAARKKFEEEQHKLQTEVNTTKTKTIAENKKPEQEKKDEKKDEGRVISTKREGETEKPLKAHQPIQTVQTNVETLILPITPTIGAVIGTTSVVKNSEIKKQDNGIVTVNTSSKVVQPVTSVVTKVAANKVAEQSKTFPIEDITIIPDKEIEIARLTQQLEEAKAAAQISDLRAVQAEAKFSASEANSIVVDVQTQTEKRELELRAKEAERLAREREREKEIALMSKQRAAQDSASERKLHSDLRLNAGAKLDATVEDVQTIRPRESYSAKDQLYLEIVDKSLNTIEEDPWDDAIANIDEVVRYFAKEQQLFDNPSIAVYHKLAVALRKFCDGGHELDETSFPDYDKARIYYQEALRLSREISQESPNNSELSIAVNTLQRMIQKELDYIKDMIGG